MHIGERTLIVFMISEFFSRFNRKFFDARILLGALENENVGGFLLRRDK